VKDHSTTDGALIVNKEDLGASMNYRAITVQQEGSSKETLIRLNEEHVTTNKEGCSRFPSSFTSYLLCISQSVVEVHSLCLSWISDSSPFLKSNFSIFHSCNESTSPLLFVLCSLLFLVCTIKTTCAMDNIGFLTRSYVGFLPRQPFFVIFQFIK